MRNSEETAILFATLYGGQVIPISYKMLYEHPEYAI